jgi:hypothetical protein
MTANTGAFVPRRRRICLMRDIGSAPKKRRHALHFTRIFSLIDKLRVCAAPSALVSMLP